MKSRMSAMLGMMLPFALMTDRALTDVMLEEPPSRSSGGKLKKGISFKRVYAGDKPYIKKEEAGRNEPCPCGSGKKHKKCCMGKSAVTESKQ